MTNSRSPGSVAFAMATPTVSSPLPDPVLETQVFWAKYRMPIILGLLAIIAGTLLCGAYWYFAARRDAAAASLLSAAKTPPAYQKVIDDYPSTPAGASAYLFLAAEKRKAGNFAEANTTLQKFISKHGKHELVTTAKMAMAANSESLAKPDEAIELYKRIAADYPRNFNAPLALLAQVPVLKQKGQVDQARQVCETVLTQYRESEAANEASRYLRTLKVPATVAAAVVPAVQPSPASSQAPTP